MDQISRLVMFNQTTGRLIVRDDKCGYTHLDFRQAMKVAKEHFWATELISRISL